MSDHDTPKPLLFSSDTIKDIFLWKRKKLSILLVFVATVTWVLLDFYELNFVTVASWLTMIIVTSLFIYGNLVRLLHKEEPKFSGWEVSEEIAMKTTNSVREMIENGIRWMLYVSAERDWLVFARVVAALLMLSFVGNFSDFLTFINIGIVLGMTIPVMYVKYEDVIKKCREWMRMKAKRIYDMMDEKVVKQVRVVKPQDNKKVE